MRNNRMANFTPISNKVKRAFFDEDSDLDYGDFSVFIYIAMYVQHSEDAGKGKANGKQGYAYTTKVRMHAELSMGRAKLDRCIAKLVKHGLIETRDVPNKYGGRPLQEYRIGDEWQA